MEENRLQKEIKQKSAGDAGTFLFEEF